MWIFYSFWLNLPTLDQKYTCSCLYASVRTILLPFAKVKLYSFEQSFGGAYIFQEQQQTKWFWSSCQRQLKLGEYIPKNFNYGYNCAFGDNYYKNKQKNNKHRQSCSFCSCKSRTLMYGRRLIKGRLPGKKTPFLLGIAQITRSLPCKQLGQLFCF